MFISDNKENSLLSETPCSNTGLNSQNVSTTSDWNLTVKLDWYQGTIKVFPSTRLEALVEFCEKVTKDKFALTVGKGAFVGKQWANHGRSAKGARIWWNLPGENSSQSGHCLLSFTGSALSNLPHQDVRFLIQGLRDLFGIRETRVDAALDDYSKRISYWQVAAAVDERVRNYTGFQKGKATKNFGEKFGGFTVNCGKPSSDFQLIFYDKNAESGGEINAYRWEARFRDELARRAIDDWLALPEEMSAQYLANLVIGRVNFVERGKEKNISRMPLLPWWKEFKDAVGAGIRHSVQRVTPNLKKAKRWINHQVACMLAAIKEVVGASEFTRWVNKEISEAPERFSDRHFARIAQWKHEYYEVVPSSGGGSSG